jgi:hypothetical protein
VTLAPLPGPVVAAVCEIVILAAVVAMLALVPISIAARAVRTLRRWWA